MAKYKVLVEDTMTAIYPIIVEADSVRTAYLLAKKEVESGKYDKEIISHVVDSDLSIYSCEELDS